MHQDTDRRLDVEFREPLRLAARGGQSESENRNRKARSAHAAAPQSITSKMLDYRSWWNLPGPKARKIHR